MSEKRDDTTEVAKAWCRKDLKNQGGLDPDRKIRKPDLTGNIHPVFRTWANKDQQDGTVGHLDQSLQLATRILEAGIQYVANFLPADQVYQLPINPPNETLGLGMGDDRNGSRVPRLIPLRTSITAESLQRVRRELNELAKFIEWQTDPLIYRRNGWHGITIQAKINEPYKAIDLLPELITASDQRRIAKNLPRRKLYIAIMSEYSNIIETAPKDSEQYLRATFMAGITIAHELGHALFWHDYRAWTPNGSEMFVGHGCRRELGHSFMSYIFGDQVPEVVNWGCFQALKSFNTPLYWLPQYRLGETRCLHRRLKSISTDYLERIMTQSSWDGIKNDTQAMLNLLQSDNRHAISFEPDFQNAARSRGLMWRGVPGGGHRDPVYRRGDLDPAPSRHQVKMAEKWRIDVKSNLPSYTQNVNDEEDGVDDSDPVYQLPEVKSGLVEVLKNKRVYWGRQEWTKVEVKYRPNNSHRHSRDSDNANNNHKQTTPAPPSRHILSDLIDSLCSINRFTDWNYYNHGWLVADKFKLGTWDDEEVAQNRAYRKWYGPYGDDLAMIAKIRQRRMCDVERKYPDDDLIKYALRKQSLLFIDNWHQTDAKRYCTEKNLQFGEDDSVHNLRGLVRYHIQREVRQYRIQLGRHILPPEVETLIKSSAWPDDLIEQHLLTINIQPSTVAFENLELVMNDLANKAKDMLPKPLPYRINADGDRVYGFMVKLITTFGYEIEDALENKIDHNYRSDTETHLFFDEVGPKDLVSRQEPLSRNGPFRDWTDLRYTIRDAIDPTQIERVSAPKMDVKRKIVNLITPPNELKRRKVTASPRPIPAARRPALPHQPSLSPVQVTQVASIQSGMRDVRDALQDSKVAVVDLMDDYHDDKYA